MTHYTNTNNPVDFPISPATMRARCETLVIAMVGQELADKWWNSPNKAFDMRTPTDMWVEDFRKVHNYLMHHAYAGGGS